MYLKAQLYAAIQECDPEFRFARRFRKLSECHAYLDAMKPELRTDPECFRESKALYLFFGLVTKFLSYLYCQQQL